MISCCAFPAIAAVVMAAAGSNLHPGPVQRACLGAAAAFLASCMVGGGRLFVFHPFLGVGKASPVEHAVEVALIVVQLGLEVAAWGAVIVAFLGVPTLDRPIAPRAETTRTPQSP